MSSLSRSAILECAITTGDEKGLGAVTVRGVADRLGVTPMALYRHVGDKESLLDEVTDALYAQFNMPEPPQGWWETSRQLAHSARNVLLAHPWALPLFARPTVGTHAQQARALLLAALSDAGFAGSELTELHEQLTSMVFALISAETQGRPNRAAFERGLALLQAGIEARRSAAAAPGNVTEKPTR